MKKLDIMNNKDPVEEGAEPLWRLKSGKVTKLIVFIPTGLVVEKEEKKKVEEVIKEVKEKPKRKKMIGRKK